MSLRSKRATADASSLKHDGSYRNTAALHRDVCCARKVPVVAECLSPRARGTKCRYSYEKT